MLAIDNLFGLVGRNISYSFSRAYFTEKFKAMRRQDYSYVNFDIASPEEFSKIVQDNPNLRGLNVTIPYKESLFQYLSDIDPIAKAIGAINTIKITPTGLVGYNTDWYGFQESLKPLLQPHHTKALIFGTGGASKAAAYVLSVLGITYRQVSRNPNSQEFSYQSLSPQVLQDYTLIINCTPIGTFPNVDACVDIPYHLVGPRHVFYDMIYNPPETKFLRLANAQGAATINGLKMLELQAEKSWEIWHL